MVYFETAYYSGMISLWVLWQNRILPKQFSAETIWKLIISKKVDFNIDPFMLTRKMLFQRRV